MEPIPDFLGPLVEISGPDDRYLDFRLGRTLPVQMPRQQLFNWCWAATTSCIASFYHEPDARSQCEVATFWLRIPCCPPGPDVRANPQNQQYNLATSLRGNLAGVLPRAATPVELQTEIGGDRPVCCMIRWSNGDQHFNVIADYLPRTQEVVVRDPKYGDAQVPYGEFCTSYRHEGQWVATLKTKKA